MSQANYHFFKIMNLKSAYIHIPFCETICSYCDFSKMYYNKKYVELYLNSLEQEIKSKYKGEKLKTIYIGGGTPSALNTDELTILFSIINIFNKENDVEFTIEVNIENIDFEKLKLIKEVGVNRLSIGVQSLNPKNIKYLNRHHTKTEVKEKIALAKELGFNNINVDIIYAIPGQTKEELIKDINDFISLDVEHISAYSLMIEPHTMLFIKNEVSIDSEEDYEMFEIVRKKLKKVGYIHYEISNYARKDYESKHNLTYWNNDYYYGFGLGASGYVDDIRYTNTTNISNYIKGNYIKEEIIIDKKTKEENEFILGFRKITGIDKLVFMKKFEKDINKIEKVKKLISEGKLIDDGKSIYIASKYLYTSNDILVEFI